LKKILPNYRKEKFIREDSRFTISNLFPVPINSLKSSPFDSIEAISRLWEGLLGEGFSNMNNLKK